MRRSIIGIIGVACVAAVLLGCVEGPGDTAGGRQATGQELTTGPWHITTTAAPVHHLADEIDPGAHARIGYLRHRDEVHALADIADPAYADSHAERPFIADFDATLAIGGAEFVGAEP